MDKINVNEQIEVCYETDIVVVGGGPAGIGAAFSAAKKGKKVIIIEQMNCLGGISTAGQHGHICCYSSWDEKNERIVGGTCFDIARRLVDEGYGTFDGICFDFEVERLKYTLEEMAKEIGNIQVLYYTQFSSVVRNDKSIEYIIIQNKSGRQAIKAKMVVDCTGDADVAASAGVEFEKGRPSDGAMQPMTLMFQIGGHDHVPFQQFIDDGYYKKYNVEPNNNTHAQQLLWKEAQENGDMEPFQSRTMGWWWVSTRPDQVGSNFTHIVGKDATNAEDLTYATIEGRRQAYHCIDVFRKYLPGMENCWMSHTGSLIGTRESRRIMGQYKITADDIKAENEFFDSIGYGSFFIDIHNCTGAGLDEECYYPRTGFKYQIPYRAIVPKDIDNLLVAGRCISCDHIALGSLRVMPQCFITGDAAGVAASMCIDSNVATKDIDICKLQNNLKQIDAIIDNSDIVYGEI